MDPVCNELRTVDEFEKSRILVVLGDLYGLSNFELSLPNATFLTSDVLNPFPSLPSELPTGCTEGEAFWFLTRGRQPTPQTVLNRCATYILILHQETAELQESSAQ